MDGVSAVFVENLSGLLCILYIVTGKYFLKKYTKNG